MKNVFGFDIAEIQSFWGVILIATGFLKLSFTETNPAPLLNNTAFLAIGIIEIIVGSAFLIFRRINFAIIGLCLFSIFLIATIYLSATGTPSCGCLGTIPFSPTLMAIADTFAIICFGIFVFASGQNIEKGGLRVEKNPLIFAFRSVAISLVLFFILVGFRYRTFEAPANLFKRESVLVTSNVTEALSPDDKAIDANVYISNLSSTELVIASIYTTTPFEVKFDDKNEISVGAFERRKIPITFRLETGLAETDLRSFVDAPSQSNISIGDVLRHAGSNGIPVFVLTNENLTESQPHLVQVF